MGRANGEREKEREKKWCVSAQLCVCVCVATHACVPFFPEKICDFGVMPRGCGSVREMGIYMRSTMESTLRSQWPHYIPPAYLLP